GQVVIGYQHWTPDTGPTMKALTLSGDKVSGVMFAPPTMHGVWHAALAADADNGYSALFDSYSTSDYDIKHTHNKGGAKAAETLVGSAAFEARPSAAYDLKGRQWIAYEG